MRSARRHLGAAGAVAAALFLGRLVRYEISEASMIPALHPGDWVIGVRRPRAIGRGDVVVVPHPSAEIDIVKRVAAVGGDAIPGSKEPLAPGTLWLLGDNPAAGSVDSRALGPFEAGSVRARIVARYRPWPPGRIAIARP
jgi:signal peptidase I